MKIGYDNNGDGDILDAGDDVQVSDNFNSNVMSLTYDNNGNLTDDGVLRYVYDGWNRLRKAQRSADGDTTTITTYSYLPDNRRASKVVEHCGIEAVANDGGDTTVHFYYGGNPSRDREGAVGGLARWNIFETRNGSNQATRQWVWGTQYVDEVLLMDVNGDPASSNICDVDDPDHPTGTRRYFYHQDRNWNIVALSEYEDGVGVNGRIAERYAYTPYGEFVVTKGDGGSGELGRTLVASSVGNPFAHQGLPFDQEKGSYQNRRREYLGQRFAQRDPQGLLRERFEAARHYAESPSLYTYASALPLARLDASGLATVELQCFPSCWVPVHCKIVITSSSSGPTGDCDCGPWCCGDAGCWGFCLTCWWTSPPMPIGSVCQTLTVSEQTASCIRGVCPGTYGCYNLLLNNCNTGASDVNCECNIGFSDPWAPGWDGDCSGW